MTSPLPAAVLWDMDGTLVDTEPYWMAAETPLVERFGGAWTHDDALGMVGLGLDDAARILQGAGVRMEVDEIVAHLTDEVMRQLREEGVPFRPGARELLRELRDAGIPTALVTMSMSRMARSITELIDFEAFDVVIGGDDVTRPKPHPDPYLQACEALGVDPVDTVAFEDSITGARSAVAAGTVTVGIPHMVSLDEVGAHELWPTLEGRTVADVAAVLTRVRQGVGA
ncbi:haloacid dehalogenase superfamily, subfamily IA, variant 3 with third motif having DD or ED [Microbacterium sp. LKL04]|uniref:HAD family phosphatase n=1 Tax=Microbacterium oleivorans TaxID=273677 RepID=A0A4R5YEY3_9MICO|nr:MULTISPECIES: HAD family phosphatase [Microbacterium]MDQ1127125.1 HAD superfamily hydrolase (TIGR01509 family) [Microbacterium sp. SORGH_AS_0505]TDL43305.1 HAD family phosphatase [Microbacterium oleivorans]SCY13637.1 haloacid dehalogenase superfamily, subfamily IA, variant 3 with third motif having DD or ED [Microbacterium sp. LKL04]